MSRPERPILGFAAATCAFVALAYPSFRLELVCFRELLRFAAAVGLSDPSRGLGGQILRYNYAREPRWVYLVAEGLAAGIAFAPAVAASILVMRRACGSYERTLCGRCGRELRGLIEPRCGFCSAEFLGEPGGAAVRSVCSRLLRTGGMRAVLARRITVACVVFAVAASVAEGFLHARVGGWILRAGEAAGGQVMHSGRVMIGPSGPFVGDDFRTELWNIAWRHGPWFTVAMVGFGAAMAAYGLCAGPLGATQIFGYRGPTRCGRCRYPLEGLREPRCPECGLVI